MRTAVYIKERAVKRNKVHGKEGKRERAIWRKRAGEKGRERVRDRMSE